MGREIKSEAMRGKMPGSGRTENRISYPQSVALLSAIRKKTLVVAISMGISTIVAGCANAPTESSFGKAFHDAFASDDPCSNNARNIGVVAGGIIGGLLGKSMAKDDKKKDNKSILIGVAAGATLGGFIGADIDRRRCELHRIAKKYDIDATSEVIEVSDEDSAEIAGLPSQPTPSRFDDRIVGLDEPSHGAFVVKAAYTAGSSARPGDKQKIGMSFSLTDKGEGGHFRTGSANLTSSAERYFGEIAAQYNPQKRLLAATSEEERRAILNTRLLLIGHTDDLGSSRLNADLSERRALSVVRFLKAQGIPDPILFYQGAGETMPIADNKTAEGRANNRRVELVELAGDQALSLYLARRVPRTEFYRTSQKSAGQSLKEDVIDLPAGKDGDDRTSPRTSLPSRRPAVASPAPGGFLDLGGVPAGNIRADFGDVLQPKKGFSLISEARADIVALVPDCSADRPRVAHGVKALRDGKEISTNEYWPGLYSSSWTDTVNGHLVALNKVAVLRDAGAPVRAPELLLYRDFASGGKKPLALSPEVNTYRGSKGLLYRVFVESEPTGIRCIDVVFPYRPPFVARDGYIVQERARTRYAAPFVPRIATP